MISRVRGGAGGLLPAVAGRGAAADLYVAPAGATNLPNPAGFAFRQNRYDPGARSVRTAGSLRS